MKSIVLRTVETKYLTRRFVDFSTTLGPATAGMFHNQIKEFRLLDQNVASGSANDVNFGTTLFPGLGDGNAQSNGNEINATGIMLRGILELPHDRATSTDVRMYLVSWNSSQGVPDSNSFYHNISNNKMLDPIDSDRYPGVKFMGTLRPSNRPNHVALAVSQEPGSRAKILFKRWLPMKKVIRQRFDGNTISRIDNLKEHMSLIFVPYDKFSTLETDRVVTAFECTATLYYKDP